MKLDKNYSIFVIGDADMAPYELTSESVRNWTELSERFKRMVWMNPLNQRFWAGSMTVNTLRQIIPMFPLSPKGVEDAVKLMNKKRRFSKV